MTRILITGGAGFLGSAVARELAEHPGVTDIIAADVRAPEMLPERTVFAPLDVTDHDAVHELIAHEQPDTIVHLAAIMNPGVDVAQEYLVDVQGTANVLEAAATFGVGRIVVSSSGAAYGYHRDLPEFITEDTPLRGNDDYSYARHKRLVEELLDSYRASHPEIAQVVLRIGTILGPGVHNPVTKLWEGKRILALRGSDSPYVFIWVEDVARIMAHAATESPAGAFNVAGTGTITTPEIANALGKSCVRLPVWLVKTALWVGKRLRLTDRGPEQVKFLQYRPVLDNTKLRTVFGYEPRYTTREAFDAFRTQA